MFNELITPQQLDDFKLVQGMDLDTFIGQQLSSVTAQAAIRRARQSLNNPTLQSALTELATLPTNTQATLLTNFATAVDNATKNPGPGPITL